MIEGFAAVYIFILAAFVGYEVISRVPVILHTPLMSGSNFVHGIVVVGAMVALGAADTTPERIVGFLAVLLGAANAVGGYAVTERCSTCPRAPATRRSARRPAPTRRREAATREDLIQVAYIAAAVLFILGLKSMSSRRTARRGIIWAGVGMAGRHGDHFRDAGDGQLRLDDRRARSSAAPSPTWRRGASP